MSGCGYDCSQFPTDFKTDNDITGIGVIIGYLVTAGIVVVIVTSHYLMTYQPDLDPFRRLDGTVELNFQPNPVDKIVLQLLRGTSKRIFGTRIVRPGILPGLEKALIKCVLAMSDVQIVTGISILVSGLAQLKCGLSCYHWQVVVNLAWFSCLTHLSCLTFLRNYLYNRPAERRWRLFSMMTLVVMVFWGTIPTANYSWGRDFGPSKHAYADYAICHLELTLGYDQFLMPPLYSVAISVALITIGFICRVIRLHKSASRFIGGVRGSLSRFARSFLRKVYNWCDTQVSPRSLKHTLCYRPLLAIFLSVRIVLDIWSSMFFEVWWLIASFSWGIIKLLSSLSIHPNGNNEWTFGQVMSVFLLAIPLITVVEYIHSDTQSHIQQELDPLHTSETHDPTVLPASSTRPSTRQITSLLSFASIDELVDDPDSSSYYDSGLLTIPVLWTTCSMTLITLTFIILAMQRMKYGPASILMINPKIYGPVLPSLYVWLTVAWAFLVCLFSSTLFSFLISTVGSRRTHQQYGKIKIISGLWALLTSVHITYLFISGFIAMHDDYELALGVSVFPLAGVFMVVYVLCTFLYHSFR